MPTTKENAERAFNSLPMNFQTHLLAYRNAAEREENEHRYASATGLRDMASGYLDCLEELGHITFDEARAIWRVYVQKITD